MTGNIGTATGVDGKNVGRVEIAAGILAGIFRGTESTATEELNGTWGVAVGMPKGSEGIEFRTLRGSEGNDPGRLDERFGIMRGTVGIPAGIFGRIASVVRYSSLETGTLGRD